MKSAKSEGGRRANDRTGDSCMATQESIVGLCRTGERTCNDRRGDTEVSERRGNGRFLMYWACYDVRWSWR